MCPLTRLFSHGNVKEIDWIVGECDATPTSLVKSSENRTLFSACRIDLDKGGCSAVVLDHLADVEASF